MVGCFGLRDDSHPSHFPGDLLVEANPRLDVWHLLEHGALLENVETRLQWGDRGYLLAKRGADILVDGTRIAIIWDEPMPGVGRPWFECPACGQRCRHVYLHDVIACRRCHRLDYACRHLRRQMPGVGRVERWRRQIGAQPRPFAPIPQRPRHHVRFHRIVAQIRAEEAKLIEYLGGIVHDLKRRIRIRKSKGKW